MPAQEWYRRAAQHGHVGALIALAALLQAKPDHAVEEAGTLFGLWLAAASRGNAVAQREVAHAYLEGHGCRVHPQAAVRWFSAAANSGDAESQYLLACCHRDGLGTRADPALAHLWFERAAERQHPAAMHWMAQRLAARRAS